jgi:hypothetical protein
LLHGTVRVFRLKFTLEDAIEFHAFAPLEASRRVTNGIPLGCPPFLPDHVVNCVQTLKARTNRATPVDVAQGRQDIGQDQGMAFVFVHAACINSAVNPELCHTTQDQGMVFVFGSKH